MPAATRKDDHDLLGVGVEVMFVRASAGGIDGLADPDELGALASLADEPSHIEMGECGTGEVGTFGRVRSHDEIAVTPVHGVVCLPSFLTATNVIR
jgi:hypothetical protein